MTEMILSATTTNLGSEFDSFLFASIGEDAMLLTVLSALARSNVDPWEEAARLARMPKEAATKSLALLIAALPDREATHLDSGTTAARLVELLPRRLSASVQSREIVLGSGVVINSRLLMWGLFAFMVIMLGGDFVVASHQPQTPTGEANLSTSATASRQTIRQP